MKQGFIVVVEDTEFYLSMFIYWREARGEGEIENTWVRGGYSWYKIVLSHMVVTGRMWLVSTLSVVNLSWDVL